MPNVRNEFENRKKVHNFIIAYLNKMTPEIKTIPEKKLIGQRMAMSLANYRVAELWKNFIPKRKTITSNTDNNFVSMAVYPAGYFTTFNPGARFEKWAAVEVTGFEIIPADMETFILPAGLYAVFYYKGLNTDNSIWQYIFAKWLPASGYKLDNRPHFELLGEKYKNNDPDSEEEIWIPIAIK